MQISASRPALLDSSAIRLPLGVGDLRDLGRKARTSGASAALMAPVAMLAGALGLAGLWAALPRPAALGPARPAVLAVQTRPSTTPVQPVGAGALGRLLYGLGAPVQLQPFPPLALTQTAAETTAEFRRLEGEMISAAEMSAQARLKTVRATFRATGLDARPYLQASAAPPLPGFSAGELHSPSLLAAKLDLDPDMARQVQRVAAELVAARTLGAAAAALPLATPVDTPVRSSPFGERTDPFTGQMAFHPGQDFSGRYGEPIHVTAPGVVSFVGQRSGYGNCVEVDHGYGFKTRYGHLSGFVVGVGTPVKTGDVIGRMGSTGRSTGVHLHYEVWASGRLLNPTPFLKAGEPALRG
jgi:murein DD-endopeptidase MepM/ murein hydrolase activator NlpD